jgi:hypothetical protein
MFAGMPILPPRSAGIGRCVQSVQAAQRARHEETKPEMQLARDENPELG